MDRERAIAEHACLKYSERVGRSAAAKSYDDEAVRLAFLAHVRHVETPYDKLLASGRDRHEARRQVDAQARLVLAAWQRIRSGETVTDRLVDRRGLG